MGELKTLKDRGAGLATGATNGSTTEGATPSEGTKDDGAAPASDPPAEDAAEDKVPDPQIVVLTAERDTAIERADKAEAELLAVGDRLAAANAALQNADQQAKADAKLAVDAADIARETIARLEARVAELTPPPLAPQAEIEIERPKPGRKLKLPEPGKRATLESVQALFAKGEPLVIALADDASAVQPFPPVVAGADRFNAQGSTLLYAGSIELTPEMGRVALRHAVLLDSEGKVLSSIRLGAVLLGGDGLSAVMAGNSLRFDLD